MRHIDRLAEPGILTKKKAQWLADFLVSGKNRPDSSKYQLAQFTGIVTT